MRKVLALLIAGVLLGGLAAGGLAVPLCSYTPPESRYGALDLGFSYRSFDDQYRDNRSNTIGGSFVLDFMNLFDSASYGYNARANARLSYNQGEMSYSGLGTGNYQLYWEKGDIFGFGGAVLRLSSAYRAPGVNIITGSGYGRFRDVTPLAKAMRIGGMLLEMKSLKGPLPDEALLAIAQEIGRQVEYEKLEQLVQKVAELIEKTGLVAAGKLGAVELLRIEEAIKAAGDKRLCGWDIRAGLGYEVSDPLGGPPDFLTRAELNYATAPSLDSQLLAKLELNSSFEFMENYSISGLVSYSQRVSPTLSYTASYAFLRLQQPGAAPQPLDIHALELKLLFTGGAGWSLTADLSLQRASDYEDWVKEFSLSASYSVF
jgi:hypothetical protein